MRVRTLFLVGLMLAPALVSAQSRTYCCTDATGRKICGDLLPQQCYDRAYKEISSSGRVREVDAPLTAEERARKDAADRLRHEAELRQAEQRRRDRVLLESYSSVGEIERRRDVSVTGAEREIEALQHREKELVDERKTLQTKLEAVKNKKNVVLRVQEDLAANASELETLRKVIVQKRREADTIRARYEEDRARFVELTRTAPAASGAKP